MKKNKISFESILYVIGGILLCIGIAFGAVQYMQNKEHNKTMESLRVQVENVSDSIEDTTIEQQAYVSPYQKIFDENADCAAWLKIPGTKVDYPVMYTPEQEEYYLYRNFYGEDDKNGCLLLAAASDVEKQMTNLLIHGHNMRSGEMFGELDNYKEQSFLEGRNDIFLYTKDYEAHYEIMSVFYGKVLHEDEEGFRYYRFFRAKNEEEFDEYYQNIKRLSLYDTGVTATFGDELITLSTCSNVGKAGRFVVVGKKVK